MDEAAPQAAHGTAASAQALEALRVTWGKLYLIGHDDEHGWWAVRRGRVSILLMGDGPGELEAAMRDDHGPVSG